MEYPIVMFSEYQRDSSPHIKEWIIFGALCIVPSVLALSQWFLYRTGYSMGLKKSSAIGKAVERAAQKSKGN